MVGCSDIDECAERRGQVCRTNQECINTPGSFTCRYVITCRPGYELNQRTGRCDGRVKILVLNLLSVKTTQEWKKASGVASYGALGHVPPSTSNNFIFSSLWSKSDSQLSDYYVICKIS